MMTNFELFFIIKDIQIQNQNQQHPLKGFNTCAFMKYIRAHNKFENIL